MASLPKRYLLDQKPAVRSNRIPIKTVSDKLVFDTLCRALLGLLAELGCIHSALLDNEQPCTPTSPFPSRTPLKPHPPSTACAM